MSEARPKNQDWTRFYRRKTPTIAQYNETENAQEKGHGCRGVVGGSLNWRRAWLAELAGRRGVERGAANTTTEVSFVGKSGAGWH